MRLPILLSVIVLVQVMNTCAFHCISQLRNDAVISIKIGNAAATSNNPSYYLQTSSLRASKSVSTTASPLIESSRSLGAIENLAKVVEKAIDKSHDLFAFFGIENSYGLSIVLFTFLSKLATLPLLIQQLEVSTKTEKLKPLEVKIKEKYQHDEETRELLLSQLSRSAKINRYAQLTSLAIELPITLAMQRAMNNLVKGQKLSESFLWIPNIQLPALQQWADSSKAVEVAALAGQTSITWSRSIAYFSLPLLYLLTRWVSSKLISIVEKRDPQKKLEKAPQEQFAKQLDLLMTVMMAYSALRLPSAILLYHLFNTIFSTAFTLLAREQVQDRALPVEVTQLMEFVDSLNIENDQNKKNSSLLHTPNNQKSVEDEEETAEGIRERVVIEQNRS